MTSIKKKYENSEDKFAYKEGDLEFVECMYCKHWSEYIGAKCKAFPDGIPEPIMHMMIKHREPYPGDNGLQFEPLNDEEK